MMPASSSFLTLSQQGPNKPESRGTVAITSANPHDKPRIEFNYISTEQDRQDWRDCIRLTREILMQPAMDEYRGHPVGPRLTSH